ncbi:carotenoid oxygenase family protein [Chondromyces apiculatus]|uniref:Putative carotenoid oxygenase n=1 Tax=Chondromyces apiculatus DSM 436 TaxID=1192034 RepID=A0A017T546_9BACT|nr:carotenoid oxygenase family protein [Chondromyces apiculatus]EYF04359.1 putative carotenoid oxygenase [Chondromyces apiculatus DSM 436]
MLLDRLLSAAPPALRGLLGRPPPTAPHPPPPNPYLQGNYAPYRAETETSALELASGEVPRALSGALYRMGPAPRYEPLDPVRYHWFDGDGMVDAFHFEDGRVSHRRRWVRTDKFQQEERAGRALFGGIRDLASATLPEGWLALGFTPLELLELRARSVLGLPLKEDQIRRIVRSQDRSNTNVLPMAGRLLTLEESAAAHELDPRTLETRGRYTFGGLLDFAPMVAHPKIDPATGVIYTFGYGSKAPYITYYVFGADGSLRLRREIDAPYASMMHDFSVTETRAIFYHLPATLWMGAKMQGRDAVRWEPSLGARLGVTSRDDAAAPVQWIDIPPCYLFHPMNAYDDGDAVVLDIARYPRLPFFDMGGESPNPRFTDNPDARLTRLRVDLRSGTVTETLVDDAPMEFPVVDPRYAMRPYRYGWGASRRGPAGAEGQLNALALYDHTQGHSRRRELGPKSFTSEPVIVPRHPDAPEGDAWLLAVVYHADEDRSELLILDALELDRTPIAVLRCPHRIPYGFHGNWYCVP